jgi:hypothetical protein
MFINEPILPSRQLGLTAATTTGAATLTMPSGKEEIYGSFLKWGGIHFTMGFNTKMV